MRARSIPKRDRALSISELSDACSPLDEARKRLGFTYSALAARLNVTPPTIWRWCHGRRRPPDDLLLLLGFGDISKRQSTWLEQRAPRVTVRLPKDCSFDVAFERTIRAVANALGERRQTGARAGGGKA